MVKEKRSVEDMTSDPAAQQMLLRAEELGISTAFSRQKIWRPATLAARGCAAKFAAWVPAVSQKKGKLACVELLWRPSRRATSSVGGSGFSRALRSRS